MTDEAAQNAEASALAETKAEEEVAVPEKFLNLVGEIEKLSVLDLAELVKVLEKKFGVSAAPVAVAAAPAQAAQGAAAGGEEKSEFALELTAVGPNKIQVIKLVREITGKGLKDAKDLVDGAPKVIKDAVPTKDAEELKAKLEAAGAKVTLK